MNTGNPSFLTGYRIACATAVVACVFSLIVGVLLVSNLLTTRVASPLDMPELEQLRAALKANPADDAVLTKIRDLDLVTRRFYFTGLSLRRTGSFLLLGGVAVALLSLRVAVSFCRRPGDPREIVADAEPLQLESAARWTLGGVIVAVLTVALYLGTCGPSRTTVSIVAAPGEKQPSLSVQRLPVLWPAFRGASGSGVGGTPDMPVFWDGATGSGILWKAEIPVAGNSSPIVAGNKVFLTGASEEMRIVYCTDLASGTLLWQVDVKSAAVQVKPAPEIFKDTGYAASTPVTDGLNVYALFANGDLVAVDHCSRVLWTTDLGLPFNRYGHSSSLAWHGGKLLIQYDQDTEKGVPSRLLAVEPATGKTLWSTVRPVSDSWPSPVVVETVKGTQLITVANDWIIAYDPLAGRELWKVKCAGTDVSPSPVMVGDLVLASVTADRIYAIRPDGTGDVTTTHVAWTSEEGVSDVPSPVSNGDLVFLVHSGGLLTCLESKTGKKIWEHNLEGEFYGSPGLAGDKLYCVARNGTVFILKAGREYEEMGRAALGEPSDGSPVFAGDRILIRGIKNLFCIGRQQVVGRGP